MVNGHIQTARHAKLVPVMPYAVYKVACICWFTSTQKCVTLSISEAEYVALGDGSWLKGPGNIVARLWIAGLTPPQFQIAMRCRCEFMSAKGDPARAMEVTQRMVEQFEKAQQFLRASVPTGNREKNNGEDGGEVAVEASVKSTGSSLKKTSMFRGRWASCGEKGHK